MKANSNSSSIVAKPVVHKESVVVVKSASLAAFKKPSESSDGDSQDLS